MTKIASYKHNRIISIIPARCDSIRLPSKHLLKVRNRTMLSYLIERMKSIPEIDEVVVATTGRVCDQQIVSEAISCKAKVFKGSLNDLVERFYLAALQFKAKIIVKSNGDNPLQATEVIKSGIRQIIKDKYEIVTGKNLYTGLPIGIGSEILTFETLKRIYYISSGEIREDPTNYIFKNLNEFKWSPININQKWKYSNLSLTVDTKKDFEFFKSVVNLLPESSPTKWSIQDILKSMIARDNQKLT